MKKLFAFLLFAIAFSAWAVAGYTDHRGHDVDSLETIMAGWTAKSIAEADEDTLIHLSDDLEELMYGFNQTNGVKSGYYARMLLDLARRHGWLSKQLVAAKGIGQHFWAKEKYDSAAFYYGIAMKAADGIPESDEKDNALSQMYGTLGNLYSMMDSLDVAMDYYIRAGQLFKKHSWNNSSSVLYYNMGETMREAGRYKPAEEYYKESLRYSYIVADSLAIATAFKGLGSLYLETGHTSRAMRYLNDANRYFADHEDEELQYRMESLDYTGQVLALQKKRQSFMILLLAILALLASATCFVLIRLRRTTQEKVELETVLEDAIDELAPESRTNAISLKPREREILELVAKGYTNLDIAEAMNLSPETIKWYKKKLFALLEASNSAELVTIAKDMGLI